MSERTAYLIPKKHFEVGEFKAKIEAAFEKLKFINSYYDEDCNWYNAGDNACLLFADGSLDENLPFEYVEVHDTENNRLLPEGLQEPVECEICHTDVSEVINDLLFAITEKEYGEKRETDMTTVDLLCPKCGQESRLPALSYHEKIAFANQYVCLVAIPDDINEGKLAEVERQLNTPFEIVYGSI